MIVHRRRSYRDALPLLARRCATGLLAIGLLVRPGSAPAAESHPFSVHDMLAMERISDPRPSPDGRRVVFVLRTTDLEADKPPKPFASIFVCFRLKVYDSADCVAPKISAIPSESADCGLTPTGIPG